MTDLSESNQALVDADGIADLLNKLCRQITKDLKDLNGVVLMGISGKGAPLARRLSHLLEKKKKIKIPVSEIDISLYRDDLVGRKEYVPIGASDIPINLDNKKIILVDDILNHGRSVRAALQAIFDYGRPAMIKLATLIDRNNLQMPILASYVGSKIPVENERDLQLKLYELDGEEGLYPI